MKFRMFAISNENSTAIYFDRITKLKLTASFQQTPWRARAVVLSVKLLPNSTLNGRKDLDTLRRYLSAKDRRLCPINHFVVDPKINAANDTVEKENNNASIARVTIIAV